MTGSDPSNVRLVSTETGAVARNPGMALDLDWLRDVRVNRSAIVRRAATLTTRRTVKKEWQTAWLLRAVACMDLTTLSGDDTPGRVRRLCAKARMPVRPDILEALGADALDLTVGAVCVYHAMVETAARALKGSAIPVAAVSAGFPAGLSPLPERVREVEASAAASPHEIDIVVNRGHVLTGEFTALYDEVCAFRAVAAPARLKTIIGASDLGTSRNVAKASLVCLMAGADFINTSTGKESTNASLPVAVVMTRAIRAYHERTGHRVGFKPAGGIGTAKAALGYLIAMKEELGRPWLEPALFRIGASSLLTDIERQLEHRVIGRYSTDHRHPMG